ncbi:epidermal growth-factor receptor (egfr) l domain protein [Echinicola sp. CAU 1574]|uniref:Epidermal growth-factor receptor (Egfr) l domain protein n=1 Tax=Echinicola arenosa TaxID=2774144 RepID=A0ABR9AJX0_9BACT|nr:epidermal growth-factor receptor (egfr) l domain protein [Echinicola arenosa]MBD8489117.1 epidermal growth-factor receptor (egfr) l domain protein [Echinicola arenosa]
MKNLILFLVAASLFSCVDDNKIDTTSNVFDGNVEIRSLDDITSFSADGYTEISGTIKINSTYDIESLNGLENLEKVNGIIISDNYDLISLEGLENILEVEFITISDNRNLTSLNGLNNLSKVLSNFRIENNDKLLSFNGLDQLSEIGDQFFVSDNKLLVDFSGLESLQAVSMLLVLNNINLLEVKGLGNIVSTSRLQFDSNDQLNNFCELTDFFQQNPVQDLFGARQNKFNPTVEEILNGSCSN